MTDGAPHTLGRIVALVCALVGLLAPVAARAQEGHGWFVVEANSKTGGKRAQIMHLPPREGVARPVSVHLALGLTRSPERLAWSGDTVYLLMPGERVGEDEVARRVYSISAQPGLMAGWDYVPGDRPESLPTLAGKWGTRDLESVGMAATPAGPVVLFRRNGAPATYLLAALLGTEWVNADLAWEGDTAIQVKPPGAADRCRLITTAGGFGLLLERADSEVAQWVTASEEVETRPATAGEPNPAPKLVLHWSSREVHADVGARARAGGRDMVYCVEDKLLRVTPAAEGEDFSITVLGASDEFPATTLRGLGRNVRVAPVEGKQGVLAFLSVTLPPPTESPKPGQVGEREPEIAYRLVEVTPTGRVVYNEPTKPGSPVSAREVQFLAVLLVMVMAAVVVFVLRPDKRAPPSPVLLPKGYIPAESGRRVMATILDLGVGWLIASLALRIDITDLTRLQILFGSPRGLVVIAVALATCLVLGTVMEWQWGLTVGKVLVGCRVLRVGEGAAPGTPPAGTGDGAVPGPVAIEGLSLGSAVGRNLAKWTPWNVAEFFLTGRQRVWAERVSGTVVGALGGADPESGE